MIQFNLPKRLLAGCRTREILYPLAPVRVQGFYFSWGGRKVFCFPYEFLDAIPTLKILL